MYNKSRRYYLFIAAVTLGLLPLLLAPTKEVKLRAQPWATVTAAVPLTPPEPWAVITSERTLDPTFGPAYRYLETNGHRGQTVPLHRVTAYNALPYQTSPDPTMSSCGPTFEGQIAVSQDLLFKDGRKAMCGKEVTLLVMSNDNKYVVQRISGIVNDTMNRRYTNAADILIHNTDVDQALAWGVRRALLVVE